MQRNAFHVSRLLIAFFAVVQCAASTVAQNTMPAWWTRSGAINTNAAPKDFAALNMGQLKNLAYKAWLEFDALPGGAGFQPDFTNAANNYAAVTVGKLKNVATPFYDRLIAVGILTNYPWAGAPHVADCALANIGQAKNLFNFIPSTNYEGKKYLIIDLSGGPTATVFSVSYLADIPEGGWSSEYKSTKLVMRRIPAGTFLMGSPPEEPGHGANETDESMHAVTLSKDYYIGVFEVTQRQWELVMGDKPSYFQDNSCYAARPVERVGYYDIRESPDNCDDPAVDWPLNSRVGALSFVGKLRMRAGLYTLDLPTEAQWEYACRAGTTTALNNGCDLTNTLRDASLEGICRYWYSGGSGYSPNCDPSAGTAIVGTYQPNAWGLYDMHGNVYEWCLDWYGAYSGAIEDPLGAESNVDGRRLIRGGAWGGFATGCRSASRIPWPSNRHYIVGFRMARTVTLPEDEVFVEFDAQGGEIVSERRAVSCGEAYGALPQSVRNGYTFSGWWTRPEGAGARVTENTVVTASLDHTLFANWTANSYLIHFAAGSGTVTMASMPVTFGAPYGTLPVPEREGYEFAGWFSAEGGDGSAVTASTIVAVAESHTLYARWTAVICTVTFSAGSGTVTPASMPVTYGMAYGNLPVPVRAEHTFVGWYAAEGGTGAAVTENTVVATASNHTLYAKWAKNTCVVAFDAAGGTGAPASETVTFGAHYPTLQAPSRPGYAFWGWWTLPDGGGVQVSEDTTVTAVDDHTLYAK